MYKRALGLLGIARKGGNIVVGEEPVGTAARAGTARLITLASDAAGHTIRRANSFAALHSSPVIQLDVDKDQLGAVFGRTSVAMLAFTDVFLAEHFLSALPQSEPRDTTLRQVHEKAVYMKQRSDEAKRSKRNKKK